MKFKLQTNEDSTCGWTVINNNRNPMSYIREHSEFKVSPPHEIRSLFLIEKGAQCVIILPNLNEDQLSYKEIHEVPLQVGASSKSNVIGSKTKIKDISIACWDLSEDNREVKFILKPGTQTLELELYVTGDLSFTLK